MEDILKLSVPVFLLVFLNVVGWIVKSATNLNNKHIPLILAFLGAILLPVLLYFEPGDYKEMGNFQPKAFLLGFIIGGAAVGANQLIRQYLPNYPQPTPQPKPEEPKV